MLLQKPAPVSTGGLRISFRNNPGLDFKVIAASDLSVPMGDWTALGSAAEVSPGRYQFTDTIAANPQRFYGVRAP
jgi:hypothetical protein